MSVGHQVTGRLPALDVAGGNRPGGAGQVAFAGQEFLIDRRAEDGEQPAPLLDLRELLDGHRAGQEEVLRLRAQALDHVLLGGVVIVPGRDGVAVHVQRGEELEHVLEFRDIGFLVDGGVGRDLVAENLRHADGLDAFLEDTFALDDQIVGEFQPVHVDIPVHPLAGADDGLGLRCSVGPANGLGLLLRDQACRRARRWSFCSMSGE